MVKLAQLKAWLGARVQQANERVHAEYLKRARWWLGHCADEGYQRKTVQALIDLDLTEAAIESGEMRILPSVDVSGDYVRYDYKRHQTSKRPWVAYGRVETWGWSRYFYTFTLAGPEHRGTGPNLSSHQGRHIVTVRVAGARQDLAIAAYRFLERLADEFNREGR